MALSSTQYTGDGTTTDFIITFPYLDRDDVKCKVDGTISLFSFLSDSIVKIVPAPLPQSTIELYRLTKSDIRLVDYINGTTQDANVFDLDSNQLFYLIQENLSNLANLSAASGGTNLQNLDMNDYKIINLADPINPQDAVNLRTLQSSGGGSRIGDIQYTAQPADGSWFRTDGTVLDVNLYPDLATLLGSTGEVFTTETSVTVDDINLPTTGGREVTAGYLDGGNYFLNINGTVYSSTDKLTWTTTSVTSAEAGAHFSTSGLVGVLEHSLSRSVYITTDGGTTWTQSAALPNSESLIAYDIIEGKVFTIETTGKVYRTDDGGTTWATAGKVLLTDYAKPNAGAYIANTGRYYTYYNSGGNTAIKEHSYSAQSESLTLTRSIEVPEGLVSLTGSNVIYNDKSNQIGLRVGVHLMTIDLNSYVVSLIDLSGSVDATFASDEVYLGVDPNGKWVTNDATTLVALDAFTFDVSILTIPFTRGQVRMSVSNNLNEFIVTSGNTDALDNAPFTITQYSDIDGVRLPVVSSLSSTINTLIKVI